jgi:hypothetical protein
VNEETALTVEVKIKSNITGLLRQAESLEVVDQETANTAGVIASGLKSWLRQWEDYWRKPKAKAKEAHAILCEREGEITKRVKPIIARLSEMTSAWIYVEREKFKKAQEERERAEWEANQKMREAESKLEDVVNFEDATAIIEEAKPNEPLPPPPVKPAVEAAQFRDHWKFRVIDFEIIPRRYLKVDESMIQEHVTKNKDKTDIPGIEAYNEPIMATRRQI